MERPVHSMNPKKPGASTAQRTDSEGLGKGRDTPPTSLRQAPGRSDDSGYHLDSRRPWTVQVEGERAPTKDEWTATMLRLRPVQPD